LVVVQCLQMIHSSYFQCCIFSAITSPGFVSIGSLVDFNFNSVRQCFGETRHLCFKSLV
jgi:hypothetical protein